MNSNYDIVIIGAGTAGLSAAIYGVRAGLSVLVVENQMHGGQIINTPDIVNYPGIEKISGYEFANQLYQHATNLGAKIIYEEISDLNLLGRIKTITAGTQTYYAKTVIIATGAKHRDLGCSGEEEWKGRGVSYCAICDGNFFQGQDVCVVGGGNTALEDALYLSKFCRTVHLIHRSKQFKASPMYVQQAQNTNNIVFHLEYEVTKISGTDQVQQVMISHKGQEETLSVVGVFVAIGSQPNNGMFSRWVEMDKYGYIVAGEDCKTNIPGVFVAGDTRTKKVRQLVTAAADGAVAATGCANFISHSFF
ncbi:thioredoxin-disulfide reductase [Clostridium facile]|uniref:Thioredoxin reductase n=1 Tax=Clostridium facile TaxID=2763035 RepID=A0ABR7IND0_9CLOT|nr:thioredoxin-disulfide reductase [Clostridium facile]MBC5786631.1 thioredoxin-disulfide reductase [Clostridium facile]